MVYTTPTKYRVGDDVYKIEPTSAACGGTHAWLRERDTGAWEMIGCICHHVPGKPGESVVIDGQVLKLLVQYVRRQIVPIFNALKSLGVVID